MCNIFRHLLILSWIHKLAVNRERWLTDFSVSIYVCIFCCYSYFMMC